MCQVLGDFAQGARKMLFRDKLTSFLALASLALALTFALLLGSIGPSSKGSQIPISRVESLAKQHNISLATLLDHDNRVIVDSFSGQRFYANYPSSGAATSVMRRRIDPKRLFIVTAGDFSKSQGANGR